MGTFRDLLPTVKLEQNLIREIGFFADAFAGGLRAPQTANERSLARFRALAPRDQQRVFDGFRAFSSLVIGAVAEDSSAISNNESLLRHVIRGMKLIVSESMFDEIENDDVVEIYNEDLVQVYRSPSFMSICNYSVLDLLTYEPYELYERSAAVNQDIFEAIQKMKENPMEAVSLSHVPSHLMRERFAEPRGTFKIEFRSAHPVRRFPQTFAGFVVLQKAYAYKEAHLQENIHFL